MAAGMTVLEGEAAGGYGAAWRRGAHPSVQGGLRRAGGCWSRGCGSSWPACLPRLIWHVRGSSVLATVQPLAGHLPAEGYTVRMQPLKLRMQGHPVVRGALRLLEFRRALLRGPRPALPGF